MKTVDKLSKEKSNFENVLASQNCVFGKFGLGFNPQSKNTGISKPFSTIAEKQPITDWKAKTIGCFLCFIVREKAILSGSIKWEKFLFPGYFKVGL